MAELVEGLDVHGGAVVMARMPGKASPSFCPVCRAYPGLDCPDEGKTPRQVRRRLQWELQRAVRQLRVDDV